MGDHRTASAWSSCNRTPAQMVDARDPRCNLLRPARWHRMAAPAARDNLVSVDPYALIDIGALSLQARPGISTVLSCQNAGDICRAGRKPSRARNIPFDSGGIHRGGFGSRPIIAIEPLVSFLAESDRELRSPRPARTLIMLLCLMTCTSK